MQFDYKKRIRTFALSYLIAGLLLLCGVSMKFNLIFLIGFSILSFLLTFITILAIKNTSQKFPNKIFKLLIYTGYFYIIFIMIINVVAIGGF